MKQQERIQASRELIIEAATKEFGTYGFDNASINRFCEDYHITKGRLYHHFSNKEDIFKACVCAAYDKMNAYIQSYHPESAQSLLEKICGFFDCTQNFFKENPYFLIMMHTAMRRPPEMLREQMAQLNAIYRHTSKEVLRRVIEADPMGKYLSVETVTEIFFVTGYHILTNYSFPNWDPEKDLTQLRTSNSKRVRKIIHMFLYGALPRDE